MIKNEGGKIKVEGSVIRILEDFSEITLALFEMLSEDIGMENARRVIANCCYVATLDEVADDKTLREVAADTRKCIEKGLEAKEARG